MAVTAVVPVGAVFFLAYGRYDGTFRDNVVFLYFMGGLLVGAFLGVLTLIALNLMPLLTLVILALFFPIALVASINRRKWQGDRHAVFNGGALGLGTALMLSFTILFRAYPEVNVVNVAQGLLLSLGLAGLLFGIGLLAGNAVRLRKQFRIALLGTAILLAPLVFLVEFLNSRAWLWVGLIAAYGLIVAVAAERRLLIEGVEPEMRKQMRRRSRKASS
jgi:hypothetical protein